MSEIGDALRVGRVDGMGGLGNRLGGHGELGGGGPGDSQSTGEKPK